MRCVRTVLVAAALTAVGGGVFAQPAAKGKTAEKAADKAVPPPPPSGDVNGRPLDAWIGDLNSTDPSIREAAIKVIPLFGPAARKAVSALMKELKKEDLSPQTNAAIALGFISIAEDPKLQHEAILALSQLANSTSQGIVRLQAIAAIGKHGAAARFVIPQVVPKIHDRHSWEIRKAAAETLGQIGYDDTGGADFRALAALLDGIDDHAREVRVECLQGLITLPPPSSSADQAQLRALLDVRLKKDKDKSAGIWLRVAMMRTDLGAATPANLAYIGTETRSQDPAIAFQAVKALGVIGDLGKSRVSDLMAALDNKDLAVVATAVWAIGRMGKAGEPALSRLEVLKQHKSPEIQQAATDTIKLITAPPAPPVPPKR